MSDAEGPSDDEPTWRVAVRRVAEIGIWAPFGLTAIWSYVLLCLFLLWVTAWIGELPPCTSAETSAISGFVATRVHSLLAPAAGSTWALVEANARWWRAISWPEHTWLWALLAVTAASVVAAALVRQTPPWSTILQRVANALVVIAVGTGVVIGVKAAESGEDPSNCQAPQTSGTSPTTVEEGEPAAGSAVRSGPGRRPAEAARNPRQVGASGTARASSSRKPALPTIAETTPTTFDLGIDRNPDPRSIRFTLDRRVAGPSSFVVTPTSFSDPATTQEIAPADLAAWGVLDPDGRSGTLYVCVRSENRLELPSGELTGLLVVDDARLARLAPEVTLNLAYPRVERVMLVGLAVSFAASWYVFFLRRDQLDDDVLLLGHTHKADLEDDATTPQERDKAARVLSWPFGFWVGYWRWATSATGVITVVAGMIAASTAFSTAYLTSDTWTASFGDWLAYTGAVATAFVAGGTAGKLAQIRNPGTERGDRPGNRPRNMPGGTPDNDPSDRPTAGSAGASPTDPPPDRGALGRWRRRGPSRGRQR